ncbi:MAG: hypothetical protein CFE28_12715 [Alphaproteobacteria bacterium PA2]|nr:MAG: hypothetical protein CFE28_12715 [Alphaproteobacteria bacterium PA2]
MAVDLALAFAGGLAAALPSTRASRASTAASLAAQSQSGRRAGAIARPLRSGLNMEPPTCLECVGE